MVAEPAMQPNHGLASLVFVDVMEGIGRYRKEEDNLGSSVTVPSIV